MTIDNLPVVLFLYKRPISTGALLSGVRKAGIKRIYIFADGPKNNQDQQDVDSVRTLVQKFIRDNPMITITTQFAKKNVGLKRSIVSGLNSVFKVEQVAVILEDDCIPHPDFFRFMAEMLTKYLDEPRIMSVAGSGVGDHSNFSYDFSKYQLCWGWGTWKRAWDHYDYDLKLLDSNEWKLRSKKLWNNPIMHWYWQSMLFLTHEQQINTWSFQWSHAIMNQDALAIIPSVNLVKNVGFDQAATNTITKSSLSKLNTSPMHFPLNHPSSITENLNLSSAIEKYYYNNPIAILGMIRQYFYWFIKKYAHRT